MYGVENQVITYPSVYMRILPNLAKAYVFITAGKDMVSKLAHLSVTAWLTCCCPSKTSIWRWRTS